MGEASVQNMRQANYLEISEAESTKKEKKGH